MLQERPACLRSSLLEATQGPPTNFVHPGCLHRQAIGNGDGGHHGRNGGNSHATTVEVSGASRGGLNQPAIMAAMVWGGESGTPEDCW